MNSGVVQLLVLAAVAIFLILKLKNVLGTRDGFEKPALRDDPTPARAERRADLSVVDGGLDRDIVDHVKAGSSDAEAVALMKATEPKFSLGEFLQGAKAAYEMILMAFQNGNLDDVRPFLSKDVDASLSSAIDQRKAQGLTVEASFHGLREMNVAEATFDNATKEAEITVRFVAELTLIVRNAEGEVVDGSKEEIKRQRDSWTFARTMGADNPNWQLVATGE